MGILKWLFAIAVVIGVCIGCFYIEESRTDEQLRSENKSLQEQVVTMTKATEEKDRKLAEMLTTLCPTQKDNILKIIFPEVKAEKPDAKTEKPAKETKKNG